VSNLRWFLVAVMAALALDAGIDQQWVRAVAFAALAIANYAIATGRTETERGMRALAFGCILVALALLALRWVGVLP
jgi:hypothetical protein